MNAKTWMISTSLLLLMHTAGNAQNTPQESLDSSRALVNGNYVNGKKDGVWKTYNRKGNVVGQATYKDGIDVEVLEAKKKKEEDAKKATEKKSGDKKGTTPAPPPVKPPAPKK